MEHLRIAINFAKKCASVGRSPGHQPNCVRGSSRSGETSMDELGLNKLFAGILVAGLMLMAGIKLADVLVPHSELTLGQFAMRYQNLSLIHISEPTRPY